MILELMVWAALGAGGADAAPPAAPAAGTAIKTVVSVAVLDFQSAAASPELTAAVQGVVAHELESFGVFQVTTGDAVRALIAQERQRQILGACEGATCNAAVLSGVQSDYLVSGKVTKVAGGKRFTLEVTLMNVAKGQREDSDVESASGEAELVNSAALAASRVMRKLLVERSGALIVTSSEGGAEVKVDGTTTGTTPLNGRLTLPAGTHRLVVDKQSFIAYQKDVRISPDGALEENAVLVPSADYIAEHKSRSAKVRLGAFITSGVAVAALGVGIGMQVAADKNYGNTTTPNTFIYDKSQLIAGNEDYRNDANYRANRVGMQQNVSYVLFGAAVVAAAAAGYFWIAGDDPGRYDKYRPLSAMRVPQGGGEAFAFTF
jgi:hypothetical protein